jgi:hypothetical protein
VKEPERSKGGPSLAALSRLNGASGQWWDLRFDGQAVECPRNEHVTILLCFRATITICTVSSRCLRRPVLAFEAKKEGDSGGATEISRRMWRWRCRDGGFARGCVAACPSGRFHNPGSIDAVR